MDHLTPRQKIQFLMKQNSEMLAEGELRSNLDESDRVRDLQDKVADLKAEVSCKFKYHSPSIQFNAQQSIN